MTLPTPKLSNEWLIRLLFASTSCIGTGATMYAGQWWAFMKDAPTRSEMQSLVSASVSSAPFPWNRDKAVVERDIQQLQESVSRITDSLEDFTRAANDQALAVRELQTLLRKDKS